MQALHKTQVFIAGGGPVGLTAAIELRRRGFAPRIIDPDMAVSPQSRAQAINPRTLDLLEPSGATEALLAAGHRIRSAQVRFNMQPLFRLDISALRHRFNFILSLPQSRTEEILSDILKHHGSILERGAALESFGTADSQITASLSNGGTVLSDLLIGADGAHSVVRKSLGLGFPGESEPQTFGLADVELDDWPFPWDQAVATLREDHVIAFLPMAEGFGRFVSSRPDTPIQ